MSQDASNYHEGARFQQQLHRANLIAYLKSPRGLERLADTVRHARCVMAAHADPAQLKTMRDLENKLRSASARPLPPELAF